jgi:hypothetical protein
MAFNSLFRKTVYFKNLSNLNIVHSKALQRALGLDWFKWIVKNTFFKYFNPKLKIEGKADIAELKALREEMNFAELNHLVGFVFVLFFILFRLFNGEYLFALVMIIANTLLNLYPSLLQQQNKSRIDKFIKRYS